MKTDISIPNPLFRSAQRLAEKLGISLSDLYAAAVSDYVLSREKESVTEALNQVYENEPSELEPELVNIQLASIGSNAW
jgi:metal-responsive CopG/Arc/MetJ family transcriptional regulator